MKLEKIKKLFLDFIFPVECLGCGKENVWLCQDCLSSIPFKSEQSCLFCREPNENGLTCRTCLEKFFLDGCLSAGNYSNRLLAKIIKTCKYNFAGDLIPFLGDFIVSFLEKPTRKKFNITEEIFFLPIPLHKKRLNWRGFNQAEILTDVLLKKINAQILPGLIRIKNNSPQAKLNEEKRKNNITGCFSWQGGPLKGKTLVLVDDVATTGATLNEAAKVLKKSGAKKVFAITAAG
jgi:ComF family protein